MPCAANDACGADSRAGCDKDSAKSPRPLWGIQRSWLLGRTRLRLDPLGRKGDGWTFIASLKAGRSILMSSHILDDVERVCTWVGIMQTGKLVVEAPLDQLLRATPNRSSISSSSVGSDELAAALQHQSWSRT